MNISLTNDMEKWVHAKVGSGLYSSASEVVREAIRAFHEREMRDTVKRSLLREAVLLGAADADQNALADWDESVERAVQAAGRLRRKP